MLLQVDDIPFYPYDMPGDMTLASCSSREEAVAYTYYANNPEMAEALDTQAVGMTLEDYFDFKRFGRDLSYDLVLADEGYLDCTQDGPDLHRYSRDEIAEKVNPEWERGPGARQMEDMRHAAAMDGIGLQEEVFGIDHSASRAAEAERHAHAPTDASRSPGSSTKERFAEAKAKAEARNQELKPQLQNQRTAER